MSVKNTAQNNQRLLTNRAIKREVLDRKLAAAIANEKKAEAEQTDAQYFTASPQTGHSSSSSVMPHFGPLSLDHEIAELLSSRDMMTSIGVIAEKMLAKNPMLESLVESLFNKLDEMAADETAEGGGIDPESLESGLASMAESGVTSFEAYVLLYEYYLKKKRARKNRAKKSLEVLAEKLDEFENSETLEILNNLKAFNSDTSAKLKLIKEFKSRANSYHGEYSEIIQQVVTLYAGNFRTMVKDMLKLSANNLSTVYNDTSRAYEQQSFMAECVYLETKVLNLMSLFCKLESSSAKLAPLLSSCNPLQLANDLVDLLDGFDFARLFANKCKSISEPQFKKNLLVRLLNINIEAVRYLPDNFFKQDKDRENLAQRLKQSTPNNGDKKQPPKAFI